MATESYTKPVEDSVAKVNNDIAVGEDLDFQRTWWRFENAVWIIFTIIIALDLAGLFGRGPIARAQLHAPDGTMDVKYERIERTDSPSMLTINFDRDAIKDGKISLYASNSLVAELGTQRIIPAPDKSVVGDGGLTYTFAASKPPATIAFALEPAAPGIYDLTLGVTGATPVHARVVVVP